MSNRFTLDTYDLRKVAIGLAVALAGAAATYLTEFVSGADFGESTPIVVAATSVLVNIVRKWAANNTPKIYNP
jgi:hypothetical protein